jgi:glycosyltransferase involved in cell wall biosynthesis
MKILFIQSSIHHKNLNFILKCKNIQFTIINSVNEINCFNLSIFDAVYSPCEPIDVNNYPNTKFIFGPHFSVFPNIAQMDMIRRKNIVYIQPSEWAAKVWKDSPLCNNIKIQSLPFGVDTEKFNSNNSISEREKVFIYFKHRDPNDLLLIQHFLNNKNYEFQIFSYKDRYNEEDYLNYLKQAKFGIWVGGHESQGFALEEALSCNVPLLVWNVQSMKQEYRSNYNDIAATSISYWDERCGEYFYNVNELENTFNTFISKLETYKPREYILENLTIEICEQKLIQLVKNI